MSLYDVPAVDAVGPASEVVAFARVTSALGLGARWPGAVALVRADGSLDGSLLGGAFDAGLVAEAPSVLDPARRATLIDVEFDHDEAERVGLPCGGSASVLVQRIVDLPEVIRADIAGRRPTALVTALDGDGYAVRALAPDGDAAYDDAGSPDALARALLARGEPSDAVVETADGSVLVSVFVPAPHLVVIGSGALAVALDAQLSLLGWTCAALTRVDDGVAAVAALGPGDGVLVIDHRGEVDFPILSAALASGVGYVAALGSRKTQEARRGRLRDGGVGEDAIARLRGPAGLDIGSRTPAEIALAITAEMLAVRATATGSPLATITGSLNAPAAGSS
jgi:xanthine dehydrogenase accessory factor